MYIINESYFQSKNFIPNLNELNSSSLDVLGEFIDDKARLCLQMALGYELFKDLDTNVDAAGVYISGVVKWDNLVNGCDYVKSGVTYRWDGLIYNQGSKKQSLLVPFVYYFWLQNEQQKLTGLGSVIINSKNATNVNATQTLVQTWNEFVTLYQHNHENTYRFYNEFTDFPMWWIGSSSNYVSLLKFLEDNQDDYPKASRNMYAYKNSFGL